LTSFHIKQVTSNHNPLSKFFLIICITIFLPLLVMPQKPLAGYDSIAFIEKTIRKVNKKVNFTIIPGPTANASQKIGFGVLPMIVYDIDRKDSLSPPSSTAALIYFDFYGSWMTAAQQTFFWNHNKWRAIVVVGYGQLRQKFFGIGRDTSVVTNNDSNYVWALENPLMFTATCYRKVVSHFYAGLEYNYSSIYMTGKDSASKAVMTQGGVDLGTTIQSKICPTFMWDNRDNIYWSTKGYYAGLNLQVASRYLASSKDFYILTGYVSGYHRLIQDNKRLSLAWRFFFQGTRGDLPYDQFPMYCRGDKVMGYTAGKYVNNSEVNGQVEVRYDIWKFLGISGFYSLGKVYTNMNTFGQSIWLPSIGANAYVTLIPYRNIRLRLSGVLARKDWGVYIGVGQMF
jgi:hypothetical protein